MAAGDAALKLVLNIVANDMASGVVSQIAKGLSNMAGGGVMGAVAGAAIAAGAAVVSIGAASIKAAGDFQSSMTKVKNLAAPATEDINKMGDSLLKIAADTGQTPQHLADGLYLVESAGVHGSAALDLLTQASKAAAVGNVDMSVIADAATTAITNFGKSGLTAGKAIDVMTATVSAGKMQYNDYAKSLAVLTTNAANGKVSFTEANAALATFTRTGQSTELASQHLGALMLYLGTQTTKMSDNAKKLGISFDANAFSAMSLGDKVQYLSKITGGNFAEVQKLMGGNKTLATTWSTLANNSAAYKDILGQLNDSAGTTDKAFQNLSGDFNFQMQRMQAAFQVLLIAIGEKLLPLATPFIKFIADVASGLTSLISGASGSSKILGILGVTFSYLKGILEALGQILGSVFLPLFGGIGNAASQLNSQLIPVIASINGVLYAVYTAASNFADWFAKLHVGEAILGVLTAVIKDIVIGLKNLGDILGNIAKFFQPVIEAVKELVSWLGDKLKAVFDGIGAGLSKVGDALKSFQKWLESTKDGANLLTSAIIGVAVALTAAMMPAIVAFLTTELPALLAGLAAWAAEMAVIAVETLIAIAPYALIAVAVAAAVFIVLEVIQHWGEISQWLADTWDAFAKWWDQTMKAIGKWFVDLWTGTIKAVEDIWNGIVNFGKGLWQGFTKWLSDIWNAVIKGIVDAWNWLVGAAKAVWDAIVNAVKTAIDAIGAALKWLYDHNYYIKDLVDFIKQAFNDVLKWAQGVWQGFVTWLTNLWKGVSKVASDTWNAVGNFIVGTTNTVTKAVQTGWTDATNFVSDRWKELSKTASDNWTLINDEITKKNQEAIKNDQSMWSSFGQWLANLWNGTAKSAVDLWNNIAHVFAGAWNDHIEPALRAFFKSIGDWFNSVVDAGKKFGENLINGIVEGIKKGFGAIGQALHDALGSALGALGFHDIPGFAGGVSNFAGGWAVVGERGPELLFLPSGSSVIPSGSPPPTVYPAASSSSGQPMIIYMMLDSRQIGKAALTYQQREVRVQGNITGY